MGTRQGEARSHNGEGFAAAEPPPPLSICARPNTIASTQYRTIPCTMKVCCPGAPLDPHLLHSLRVKRRSRGDSP